MNAKHSWTAWLVCVALVPQAIAQVAVRDDMDRTIHLQGRVERVVALNDFLADLVIVAGGGARLVAVGGASDTQPRVMGTPTLATGEQLSLPKLVALKPDVVFGSLETIRPEDVDRLEAAGINVFLARDVRIEDPPRLLRTIVSMLGTDSASLADAYEEKIARLRRANFAKPGLKVFIELSHRPLKTVSGNHFWSEALEVCQTRNIFSDWKAPTSIITYEHAAVRDPDVIVGISSASDGHEFRSNWSTRPALRAVREKRLLFLYAESPQAPSMKTARDVEQLCEGLDAIRASFR